MADKTCEQAGAQAAGGAPLLELRQVSKMFGAGEVAVQAVDDVSFSVRGGEIVLIMGPSGSGKTTLLSIAGALMKPTTGRVLVGGRDITELSEGRLPDVRIENIGFVFQAFNLLSSLTALENVVIALNLRGVRGHPARARSVELMRQLGLEDRMNHYPSQLSGGQQQRVAIARSLANDPKVVLADEPTGNLDSKSGHDVMNLLCHEIKCQGSKGVVIVSHDERIRDIADRVLWLEDGRITEREN